MRKPTAPPHVAKPVVVEAPSATPAALLHAEISGTVELVAGRGQQVAAGDRAETAVYFVPKNGNVRARPGQYTVYTDNHDFKPAALAIPLGSTVTFTNLDDVRHSVYSATPGAAFDLGFQATGEKVAHVFGNQGFVLIGCKVHRTMELDMLVVPTSYVTRVAANGSFSLRDLPAGPGTLYFWNPRAGLASEPVTLPMTGAIHQRMTAIKPHVATELHVGSAP